MIITTIGGATTTLTSPPGGGVTVVDASLMGHNGTLVTGVEGASTGTQLIGTFTDANPGATVADFTSGGGSVVVNWGDGSAPQTLTAADLTALGSPNGVVFSIDAAHTYTEEGSYPITITVTDDGGSATLISSSAVISDAPLTAGAAVALTPNTGQLLTDVVVATFTDANTFATASDFTAVIDWGDGSPNSLGAVLSTGGGGFEVEGTHAYANPGSFATTTVVTDVGGSVVTIGGTATVTDLAVTGAVRNFTAVEGQDTGTIVLATFTDPNPLATVASVSATLPAGGWGDGTPGASGHPHRVVQTGITGAGATFEVLGDHTYADEGAFTVNISVTTSGGVTTALTSGTATVLDAALVSHNGTVITGVEGASTGTVLIGTFTDDNPGATSADFTAGGGSVVVNWGDGSAPQTLTAANLTALGVPAGVLFSINAAHTYGDEGTYPITITVTDDGGSVTVVSSAAHVSDAPLTAGAPVALTPNTGQLLSNVVVANFTDANTGAPVTDFTAVIDWGDGTANSVGTVVSTGGGGFSVEGTHAYANPGVFATTTTVTDVGGSVVVIGGTATVTDVATTGTVRNFTAVEGQNTGTIVLGTFTDPNPLATVSSVSAFLPAGGWGDGTPTASTMLTVTQTGITAAGVTFEVTGSHTYAEEGSFTVNVSVTTSGGVTTALTSGTATVIDAALVGHSGHGHHRRRGPRPEPSSSPRSPTPTKGPPAPTSPPAAAPWSSTGATAPPPRP